MLMSDGKLSAWTLANRRIVKYEYGDATLNTTSRGYDNLIYKASHPGLLNNVTNLSDGNVWAGYNIQTYMESLPYAVTPLVYDHPKGGCMKVISGSNTVNLTHSVPSTSFCLLDFRAASYTSSIYITGLRFQFGGIFYTLQEAITANLIENMVLLCAYEPAGSTYVWTNWINNYVGGTTSTKSYPRGCIAFITKVDTLSAYSFTTNKAWSTTYPDGTDFKYCDSSLGMAMESFV